MAAAWTGGNGDGDGDGRRARVVMISEESWGAEGCSMLQAVAGLESRPPQL